MLLEIAPGPMMSGTKPVELAVQLPTKFVMSINLKTAKGLGLDVPLLLQQRADEVIDRGGSMSAFGTKRTFGECSIRCLLLGVKRTSVGRSSMSTNDPKRTSTGPLQLASLSQYDLLY